MSAAPSFESLGLLLGLSFFLGLAFEDFFAQAGTKRPGGIRTFPLLALAGGMLYLFDPVHLIPYTGGLLVLGAWLAVFYREHIRERDEQGEPNVGLVVLLLNVHAYLLGAITLALPNWIAVGTTVAAVLLLTGRERLHELARRVEMKEIITAGQFLILTGLILPLLPTEPVTTLTSITPRQAWLALVVVCTLSYASYLAQRYWAPAAARPVDGSFGRSLLVHRDDRCFGAPSQIRQIITKARASWNHSGHRDYVSAHPSNRSCLQLYACATSLHSTGWPFLGCGADLRTAILVSATVAIGATTQTGQPESPRTWRCSHFCGSVRSHLITVDVGHDGVRHCRCLLARCRNRDYRYRPLRSQFGARWHFRAFQVMRLRRLSSSPRPPIICSRQAMQSHLPAAEPPCRARLHLLSSHSGVSQLLSQWAAFGP